MQTIDEKLRLLSIFHYVAGGITCVFGLFPLIHVTVGVLILSGVFRDSSGGGPPLAFGLLFAFMGLLFLILFQALGICTIISGRKIAARKSRMFSVVVAAILCAFPPICTVLGVFTIIVLVSQEAISEYESPLIAQDGWTDSDQDALEQI